MTDGISQPQRLYPNALRKDMDITPKRLGIFKDKKAIGLVYVDSKGATKEYIFPVRGLSESSNVMETVRTLRARHQSKLAKVTDEQLKRLVARLLKLVYPYKNFSFDFPLDPPRAGPASPPPPQTVSISKSGANSTTSTTVSSSITSQSSLSNTAQSQSKASALPPIGGLSLGEPKTAQVVEDFNKLDDLTLTQKKKEMDVDFERNRLKPGDPGFEFDVRKEFVPTEECSWDDKDDDTLDAEKSEEDVFAEIRREKLAKKALQEGKASSGNAITQSANIPAATNKLQPLSLSEGRAVDSKNGFSAPITTTKSSLSAAYESKEDSDDESIQSSEYDSSPVKQPAAAKANTLKATSHSYDDSFEESLHEEDDDLVGDISNQAPRIGQMPSLRSNLGPSTGFLSNSKGQGQLAVADEEFEDDYDDQEYDDDEVEVSGDNDGFTPSSNFKPQGALSGGFSLPARKEFLSETKVTAPSKLPPMGGATRPPSTSMMYANDDDEFEDSDGSGNGSEDEEGDDASFSKHMTNLGGSTVSLGGFTTGNHISGSGSSWAQSSSKMGSIAGSTAASMTGTMKAHQYVDEDSDEDEDVGSSYIPSKSTGFSLDRGSAKPNFKSILGTTSNTPMSPDAEFDVSGDDASDQDEGW